MPVGREMGSAARNLSLRVVDYFVHSSLFIFEVCKWKLLNY